MEELIEIVLANPIACIVGAWLVIGFMGLYSSTRGEYLKRSRLGGLRRYTRDSNQTLKERTKYNE